MRVARRRKRERTRRVGALSFLLMTMSIVSFSLSAWFYVTVQQRMLVPETLASRVLGRGEQGATAPPQPEVERENAPSTNAPELAPQAEPPQTEPQAYQAVPAVEAEPPGEEPRAEPVAPVEPSQQAPPQAEPVGTSPPLYLAAVWSSETRAARSLASLDMAPQPRAPRAAVRSREGHLAQEVHRFSLGPGQAPALVTAVDSRLVWTIIGVFLLSNLLFITSLGSTGAPLASAHELEP